MKNYYFVFGSLFDYWDVMCNDLKKLDNCQMINQSDFIKNPILHFIYKVHNSGAINKYMKLPGKSWWYKYYFDRENIVQHGGGNFFVFFDSNPHVYNPDFLTYLHKKVPNAMLTLLFVNSMCMRNMKDIVYFKKYFDYIYTIDKTDAENYGFDFIETIHSKLNYDTKLSQYDIVFCGQAKNRSDLLFGLYKQFTAKGMKCKFTVVGTGSVPNGIHARRMSYKEMLDEELLSKCILEVCSEGQNSYTLRAAEAIMYDKYLITNNKVILESKYYDPGKIFYFESLDDLRNIKIPTESCSYNYQGDFSPVRILEDITSKAQLNIDL